MNSIAIEAIREAINKWKSERRFTFENKQVHNYKSPIKDGEYILRFSNSVESFFCDKKQIKISLSSRPFHTDTLSDNPLSDNPKGDKYRLEMLLSDFDNDFYSEVEIKLNDCIDNLTTSDPLFF
jgi:hypothetical protein